VVCHPRGNVEVSMLSDVDVVQHDLDRITKRLNDLMQKVDFENSSYPVETYDRLADLKTDCEDLNDYLNTYSSYDPG